jgi:tRNA pseudouridine55 synthase
VTSDSAESGLVVVDKPSGMTSHDVVARVRRLARTRKVGHAGTLDPMATGVLLLGVNRATRLLGHLALTEKRYDATMRLGMSTTTDDAEGEPLTTDGHRGVPDELDEAAVAATLPAFTGAVHQVPSAVSAVKVDGQRAYRRVRAGEAVELPPRAVTIHELALTAARRVEGFLDVDVSVRCSSGTYVRAIARDLGAALGVGGHLTALRRTEVGGITLAEATPLAELEQAGAVRPLPMATAVGRFFPTVALDEETARRVRYGRPVPLDLPDGVAGPGPVAVLDPDGAFLALYEPQQPVSWPVAVFV